MTTECHDTQLQFQGFGGRAVQARFDAGRTSSDGGLLLAREYAERSGLLRRFSECFVDHRNPDLIEHTVEELVNQRVMALVCGYEDLNDHDVLRDDALLALASGKEDITGEHRVRERDRGHALAGKSTLNRFELTPEDATARSRYKKIVYNADAIDAWFVTEFIARQRETPKQIVLDLDATDDPLHGHQEGRFFHGYYRAYCYLPLYIFCGDELLCARLRRADIDASAGTVDELERIVPLLRARWPHVEIIIRADSGFARDEIMAWCERNGVHFVIGLAKNARLQAMVADALAEAEQQCEQTGLPARRYREQQYRTLKTWSRERRVVAKAEYLMPDKANPRFVVTSLPASRYAAQVLYEKLYCARGEMENRIKEQQLCLFADRTSTATMRANQLRLYFSSVAYVLMQGLRATALPDTAMQQAQCDTIRTRLMKVAAVIKISVRRVYVSLSSSFAYRALFETALSQIQRAYPLRI